MASHGQGWYNARWIFVIQVFVVQKLAQLCLAKLGPKTAPNPWTYLPLPFGQTKFVSYRLGTWHHMAMADIMHFFLCDPSPGCPETGPTVFGQTGPPEQHQTLEHVNPSPLAKSDLFLTRLDTWHHMAKFDICVLNFCHPSPGCQETGPTVLGQIGPTTAVFIRTCEPLPIGQIKFVACKTWHMAPHCQGWHNATWNFVIQVILVLKLAQLCLAKQGPCGGSGVVVVLVIFNYYHINYWIVLVKTFPMVPCLADLANQMKR